MKKLNVIDWIAIILVVIGGVNWGLVGIFDFDVVRGIFGENYMATTVYVIVGVAALWMIYTATKMAGGSSKPKGPESAGPGDMGGQPQM